MSLAAQFIARTGTRSDIRGHLEFIHAEALGRAVIAELGVRSGNSTCAILAAIGQAGLGELWSVDQDVPWVPRSWYQLPHWHFLQADDISGQARSWVPEQLDMLLIDTSHDQDHTLAELVAYGLRVREGGVILCHDTQWVPGDLELREPTGPVARALDVWCQAGGMAWENRAGSYGMGVIRINREMP